MSEVNNEANIASRIEGGDIQITSASSEPTGVEAQRHFKVEAIVDGENKTYKWAHSGAAMAGMAGDGKNYKLVGGLPPVEVRRAMDAQGYHWFTPDELQ